MNTAYISHPDCLLHDTGDGHPESAGRLHAIEDRLNAAQLFYLLRHLDAPDVTREQLLRVHTADYLELIEHSIPEEGLVYLDPDSPVSPKSLRAARRAAGAAILATDLIMNEEIKNAFCSVRPPGHHATKNEAMGFCVYNNVAVGAAHALEHHGVERVAILDFDVHHGNGTEHIFKDEPRALFCSSFQHPFYPQIPFVQDRSHIVNVPLPATAKSTEFREAITSRWLPALEDFNPDIIYISAGFDAHRDDDMSGVSLVDDDYRWITERIVEVADAGSNRGIVSMLEGGYDLPSLARSVETHIRVLMGLH